ncbi:gp16 family protein [Wielerella bovis]|uniref:gp16 family protein n=1 Tax=Wielerella bovis TaxID=2917790 RepID=UPI002019C511|nr:regulatory protein GemA [Wielerella bovis]ULJ61042.1 regulatory protein GemA [Wielerella bovis]
MTKQSDTRQKMLAKIHIAKNQLDLDDDVYRDLLEHTTGLRSCSKMNKTQLENVLLVLKRKGFRDDFVGGLGRMPLHLVEHRPMMNKIAVLLKQTGKTWAYANGMAQKMFQKERLNLLNSDEMHRLLKALQIYTNRHTNKGATNET